MLAAIDWLQSHSYIPDPFSVMKFIDPSNSWNVSIFMVVMYCFGLEKDWTRESWGTQTKAAAQGNEGAIENLKKMERIKEELQNSKTKKKQYRKKEKQKTKTKNYTEEIAKLKEDVADDPCTVSSNSSSSSSESKTTDGKTENKELHRRNS